jgi:hypothetical protein
MLFTMTSQQIWIKLLKVIILILLACAFLFSGCSTFLSDDDYRTIVVNNDVAGFSFEYRAYYHDIDGPSVVEESDYQFTYIYVLARTKERPMVNPEPGSEGDTVAMSYVPASMHVLVSNQLLMHSKYSWTASERIENSISSWSRWKNFKLLERTTVVVAGIEAEMIAYEIDSIFSSWPLEYHIEIAFDREGICWDIEATCRDTDLRDMLVQDVEHVISTFKILE